MVEPQRLAEPVGIRLVRVEFESALDVGDGLFTFPQLVHVKKRQVAVRLSGVGCELDSLEVALLRAAVLAERLVRERERVEGFVVGGVFGDVLFVRIARFGEPAGGVERLAAVEEKRRVVGAEP